LIRSRTRAVPTPHDASVQKPKLSGKPKVSRHLSGSIATQLFGAPVPNRSPTPVMLVVMLASVVPAGSARTGTLAVNSVAAKAV
jgi:hypothetical protein